YCPDCKKGVRTKIDASGDKKIRVCAKCGHKFD
ncbi:MAG: 50S ribosomal protein L24, partial [Clostridia bacterium]|nr:50S ribosomal protein L24 [Clostridia bacterium]